MMKLQATLLLLCVGTALGQGIPSAQECQRRVDSIGQSNILQSLSSCTGSTPSASCCRAANNLLGFPGSGRLAGCLCNAESLQATLDQISSNSLARLSGVTRSGVQNTLNKCNVPNIDLEGSCPSSNGAATVAASSAAQTETEALPAAKSETKAQVDAKSETKATADANSETKMVKDEPKSEKRDDKAKVVVEKNIFWKGDKKCEKDCGDKREEEKCNKGASRDKKDCRNSHHSDKDHLRHFHHDHPILAVLTGRRLLGDVEVKALGAAVAVSKTGVTVEAERPVIKAVAEAKDDVPDHFIKTVDLVTDTDDLADEKFVEVVHHDSKKSTEHRPVRRVIERVHDHNEKVFKVAIDVHKAVHRAVVDALKAKVDFVSDIHNAKRDALEDAHNAKSDALVSVVAKSG